MLKEMRKVDGIVDDEVEDEVEILPHVFIPTDYNINQVPPSPEPNVPLLVNFSMNLKSILDIDERGQMISIESTLRVSWYDTRIRVDIPKENPNEYLRLNRNPTEKIFFPDVFVDKAKDLRIPTYNIRPSYLRIYNDSKLFYSARVNYDIACPMDFANYPVDTQVN